MRLVEQYYGPVRRDPHLGALPDPAFFYECECYIKVEVNRQYLHVKSFFPRDVPAQIALRDCRQKIMHEVEREVFGG